VLLLVLLLLQLHLVVLMLVLMQSPCRALECCSHELLHSKAALPVPLQHWHHKGPR
jgi:hypothetical protein